jgi:lipopolysaccharide transport system permease protein
MTTLPFQPAPLGHDGPRSGPTGPDVVRRQVIEPGSAGVPAALRDAWAHRGLLWLLAGRELSVRYKQTLLGPAWAVLQPLALVCVFWLFFGVLGRADTGGVPHVVFYFAAMVPWRCFDSIVSRTASSLVADGGLMRKVYVPRLLGPARCVVVALADAALAGAVLLIIAWLAGVAPSWRWALLPLVFVPAVAAGAGVGLLCAGLHAIYRDVGLALPTVLRLWFFASPVLYAATLVPDEWRGVYAINPMVEVLHAARWCVDGQTLPDPSLVATACVVSGVLLVVGLVVFQRLEPAALDRA